MSVEISQCVSFDIQVYKKNGGKEDGARCQYQLKLVYVYLQIFKCIY